MIVRWLNGLSTVYMWGVQWVAPFVLLLKSHFDLQASDFDWIFHIRHNVHINQLVRNLESVDSAALFFVFCCTLHMWIVTAQNLYCGLPLSFHQVRLFWLCNENKWWCSRAAATRHTASSIPIWMRSIRHHRRRTQSSLSPIVAVTPPDLALFPKCV